MTVPKGPKAGPGSQYRVANGEQKVRFACIHREQASGTSETASEGRNGVLWTTFVIIDFRLERPKNAR